MRLLLFLSALLAAISGSGTAARAANTPPMTESVRVAAAPIVASRRSVQVPVAADFASGSGDAVLPLTVLALRPTPLYAAQPRE